MIAARIPSEDKRAEQPPTRRIPRTPLGWASPQRGSAMPLCATCNLRPRAAGQLDCERCLARHEAEEVVQ